MQKIKLLIVINQLLDEAIQATGICQPSKAWEARVKMELVKYLNFKYRDNTIVVDFQEEYQDFIDNGPKIGFSAPPINNILRENMSGKIAIHGKGSAERARSIAPDLRQAQMDEAFATVNEWLTNPQG